MLNLNLFDTDLTNAFLYSGIGYYYNRQSADKVQLNKSYFAYSLKWVQLINDNGVFLQTFVINHSVQISAGLVVRFVKDRT